MGTINRTILSGGTGFVGCAIWKFLSDQGYEVENISSNEFMHEDFSRLDSFKPEVVIHCGWTRCQDLFATDHLEMAELSCHFFNECHKRGIRVINMGSGSEYGIKYEPYREDMVCEPISTYGIAKLSVTLYAKMLGYNTFRLFAASGEGGRNFKSVYKLVDKWGHPNNVRHYIDVKDVAIAVERLMHARHLFGEVINLADPDIAGMEYRNSEKWNTFPQRQYEMCVWEADTTKLVRLLNV
jgi:nucleoside-diphosphate-sugar epimerase